MNSADQTGNYFIKSDRFTFFKNVPQDHAHWLRRVSGGGWGGKLEVAEVSRLNLFYVNDNVKKSILAMTGVISS